MNFGAILIGIWIALVVLFLAFLAALVFCLAFKAFAQWICGRKERGEV